MYQYAVHIVCISMQCTLQCTYQYAVTRIVCISMQCTLYVSVCSAHCTYQYAVHIVCISMQCTLQCMYAVHCTHSRGLWFCTSATTDSAEVCPGHSQHRSTVQCSTWRVCVMLFETHVECSRGVLTSGNHSASGVQLNPLP